MNPGVAIDLFGQALWLVIMIVSLLVVPGLLVGLVISMFQAATQINEQTLSFLPHLLTTLTALIVAGPYILNKLMDFTLNLVGSIPAMLG